MKERKWQRGGRKAKYTKNYMEINELHAGTSNMT